MEMGTREWNAANLLCCTFYVPVRKQNILLSGVSVKASLFMPQSLKREIVIGIMQQTLAIEP